MNSYAIIGIMSGTSMDGVDLSFCRYNFNPDLGWSYTVEHCESISYPIEIMDQLENAKNLSVEETLLLNKNLSSYFADCVLKFMEKNHIDSSGVQAIASHGHTIFHQPARGFTFQIGCGDTLAFLTGIKVINDFRQKDVIAGGQGAPLVPIGDLKLFAAHADAFLNIGGFANITFIGSGICAYDICPGNLPLNRTAGEIGKAYDADGQIAAKGEIEQSVLEKLNSLDFYNLDSPKSLGTEWLDEQFMPVLNNCSNVQNKMRTAVEHISTQIAFEINKHRPRRVMITGGGAYNKFLITRIKDKVQCELYLPEPQLIDFKEAIVFGFLGALYLKGETNSLAAVTGAEKPTVGGVLHLP